MSASPSKPSPVRPVQYKGADLEAERGPGLGCFRFQLALLLVLIVLTPISVLEDWPSAASAGLLFLTIALLLVAGQTIIFLLRLVAADRAAGRRRPMASRTRTVGEIEDAAEGGVSDDAAEGAATSAAEGAGISAAEGAGISEAEGAGISEAARGVGPADAAQGESVGAADPAHGASGGGAAATGPARSDGPLPSPPDMRQ